MPSSFAAVSPSIAAFFGVAHAGRGEDVIHRHLVPWNG
jgi:hypothetical protein